MSYDITKHLTLVNKGKEGGNKPEYIVIHYVGASGQAMANARYFYSTYRGASAHYFIDPTTIAQVVEENTPAWHVGDGSRSKKGGFNGYVISGGATNNNSIGIELCQDTTTGKNVWTWDFHPDTVKKAEWLVRKLQKKYGISNNNVIRHFDVSGKTCPGNWSHNGWAKWWEFKDRLDKTIPNGKPTGPDTKVEGKSNDSHMHIIVPGDTLSGISKTYGVTVDDLVKWNDIDDPNVIFPETKIFVVDPEVSEESSISDIEKMARDVLDGKYGNGEERKKKLGSHYQAVQSMVNNLLLNKAETPKTTPKAKSISELAQEVIDGKHGTGTKRKQSLGSNYEAVQKMVNDILSKKSSQPKSISQLADEVIRGLHGTGRERMISLGSNYAKVQQEVNRRLRNR